jgi:hypothetical protein
MLWKKTVRVQLGTREIVPFVSVPFYLGPKQLGKHIHYMGVTEVGKSKSLAWFASSLILQGYSCAVIDPHADLAHDVLRLLMDNGLYKRQDTMQKVWYLDFSREDAWIAFNVLKQRGQPHTIAESVLEAFHRAYPELSTGSASFDTLVLNGVMLLIANSLPLTALYKLLTDGSYRKTLYAKEKDESVVAVFRDWFDLLSPNEQSVQAGSARRRANLLTFHPAVKHCLGQSENRLDFRKLMDEGVSLIVNLGGLSEGAQRLLGCLLTVGFEQAALSREDIPEEDRRAYKLFLDEFSMFSAQSEVGLARMLSLVRKYKLTVVFANQDFAQFQSSQMRGALQNTLPVYFRLGRDDAVWAAERLGRADPEHIKHEVRALGGNELKTEPNPSYFSLQEEFEGWARRIEEQWEQHCFVKVNRQVPKRLKRFVRPFHTYHIRTVTVPKAKHSHEAVEKVKEAYAKILLTPLGSSVGAEEMGAGEESAWHQGLQGFVRKAQIGERRERHETGAVGQSTRSQGPLENGLTTRRRSLYAN